MNISIIEKNIKEIQIIKPLWEKLNLIYLDKSIYFKSKYENFTFDKRMESVYKKSEKVIMKLDLLLDNYKDEHIGYCSS